MAHFRCDRARLAELAGLRLRGETRLVPVAVQLRDAEPVAGAVTINLAGQPLAALVQARERILGQVIG